MFLKQISKVKIREKRKKENSQVTGGVYITYSRGGVGGKGGRREVGLQSGGLMSHSSVFQKSFIFMSLNFLLWGHVLISSDLLFRQCLPLSLRISNFSVRQTSHFLVPHRYFLHFFIISHVTLGSSPLSLQSQM